MRLVLLVLLVVATGCPSSRNQALGENDSDGNGPGSGSPGSLDEECSSASDCVAAGPKCCDCPTHAVPTADPAAQACSNVDCVPKTCGSPMEAACVAGACELVCSPVTCDVSCDGGFATDSNGCLTCGCNVTSAVGCTADSQCVRVNADCCGCEMGGEDTAVLASEADAYGDSLMCPQNPSCPAVYTCEDGLEPRCISGECTLVVGPLPSNACGRPDLPPCPAGEVCTLNANDSASMQGVGVCQPAP